MAYYLGGVTANILDPLVWTLCLLIGYLTKRKSYSFRVLSIVVLMVSTDALLAKASQGFIAWIDIEQAVIAYFLVANIVVLVLLRKPKLAPKEAELCEIVADNLRIQIRAALKTSHEIAEKRLNDLNATGYIFGYIDRYLKFYPDHVPNSEIMYQTILDRVVPGKLVTIFKNNYARYQIAIDCASLATDVEDFEFAVSVGVKDAEKAKEYQSPKNLERYLLGKKPKI